MKRKLMLLLTCLFVSIGMVTAQTSSISGVVISDEDGLPIVGASVLVKGTTIGTITDLDGQFMLSNIPSSSKTLQVSYIGMETQELAIKPNMRIVLKSDSQEIDEVIVVAYGTAKKSAFTGSASTVKADKIAQRQVSNVTNALAGQVAGVQTTSTNGQPGEAATVRIRGIGSMSSSNDPLYVVDGMPYDGNISAINPQDIESMNVLKDAAASAIYGARGANGVVVITTKRATTQEAVVTLDAKWGNNSRAVSNYEVMDDPAMYYETFYRGLYNSKAYTGSSVTEAHAFAQSALLDKDNGGLGYLVYSLPENEYLVGTNFKLNPNARLGYNDGEYYYKPDDWYKELFDKGNLRQEYNISVSGSNDKMNYYFSLGYLDDSGIVSGSGFTRYTARSKVDYQAKKWLKIGANMAYTNYNSKSPTSQTDWGSSGNLFYVTSLIAPIYPLYVRNPNGNIKVDERGITVYDFGTSTNQNRAFMGMSNPGITMKLDKHNAYTDVITSKFYGIVDIIEGLQFTANVGLNVRNVRENHLYNQFYGSSVSNKGATEVEHYREIGINQQYLLTYKKSFSEHNLDFLVGYEAYDYKEQDLYGSNTMLYNPWVGELGNAVFETPKVDSYTNTYTTLGVLGRVQYDYDGKYFLSGSYRRDASSRFHPDNRWGNFGSIGGAWLIDKEDFFDVSWVNLLKLKMSYGIQGNDHLIFNREPNYYAYLDRYEVKNSDGGFATSFYYKGNKDITWETSYSFNVGTEFGLFNERINGSVEYFSRKTVDLLYNQPVPISLGYATIPMNIGSIRNSGFELDLNGVLIKTRDLTWSLNVNATTYKNKILDLESSVKENGIQGGSFIYKIDGSLYNAYLRKYAGVDKNTGKALYYIDPDKGNYDTTDDWNSAKQADLGSTLAKVYGGFGTSLNGYGFDFNISFSYQLGGKVYDTSYQELMHNGDNAGTNWHKDILKAWTPENVNTNIPRLSSGDDSYQLTSSRFLVSSDYLSLNNITLGYTFPRKIVSALGINSLRIYAVGDNLAIITARKGLDPRQNLGGIDNFNATNAGGSFRYTALRTISGGITVSF